MRAREFTGKDYAGAYRGGSMLVHPGVELPPGASFDPDPHADEALQGAVAAPSPASAAPVPSHK